MVKRATFQMFLSQNQLKKMKKKKETIGFGYYNTELCVDLKTILLNDPVMKMNMAYPGTLVKDGEEHFLFTRCVDAEGCR